MMIVLASLVLSLSAQASIEQAPPNFITSIGKAVFVDFKAATYDMQFDLKNQEAKVFSEIQFNQLESGYPVINSMRRLFDVTIDGEAVTTDMIYSPDSWVYLTRINKKLEPGTHVLKSMNYHHENVVFADNGVASALWCDDLNQQSFLELYAPANLEYDQFQMTFKLSVSESAGLEHELYANGIIAKTGENAFTVTYPAFYTSSSMFLHLMPKGSFGKLESSYQSTDGRQIPITIYGKLNLQEFLEDIEKTLAELEADYGPWPHAQVLVYATNDENGGMEYSGATVTDLWALEHELFHSYHARSQMPANGNSGWLDEAIASFRDYEYKMGPMPKKPVNMANRSPYATNTSTFAYSHGKDLMNYFNKTFFEKGLDFKTFLRAHYEKYQYQTVTTQMFLDHLNRYSGIDFTDAFKQAVYGQFTPPADSYGMGRAEAPAGSVAAWTARNASFMTGEEAEMVNPYHKPRSPEQLRALLK